jgi:hypothetical protein
MHGLLNNAVSRANDRLIRNVEGRLSNLRYAYYPRIFPEELRKATKILRIAGLQVDF